MGEDKGAGLYSDILDMADIGFLVADPQGRIAEANERFCGLVGIERDSLLGAELDVLPFALPLGLSGGGEGKSRELPISLSGGRELVLEMRSRRGPDGSLRAVFRDLTEERKAERELRLRSLFLEAVANSTADGILVVDPLGKKILQNKRTVELWKIPPEVAADPSGDKQVGHVMAFARDPGKFIEEIERQKRSPLEVSDDQLELVDGTVLDRHSAPVLGADGGIRGRVYTFHDVTGFRRAEERIRGLLEEKEAVLRESHHRVKNYMLTLRAILSLHARALEEPSAISALGDAQRRVELMMALYDKLYVQAGFAPAVSTRYMSELVEEIIAIFPRSSELSLDQKIEDFALDGKTMRTLGIIVNELITNIMKYAFEGRDSGKIGLSLVLAGEKAVLELRDDGVGFDSPSPGKGPGFGLTLVDALVKQLGGTIAVERGGGTRYRIEFEAAGLVRP